MRLSIVSRVDGFRRAGRAWSATATEVDSEEFDAGQLRALREDPVLIVTEAAAVQPRAERVAAAVADVAADPARCAKNGKPHLAAVRDAAGLSVTAAERDAAWAAARG